MHIPRFNTLEKYIKLKNMAMEFKPKLLINM